MDLKSINFEEFANLLRGVLNRELEQKLKELEGAVAAAKVLEKFVAGDLVRSATIAEILPVTFDGLPRDFPADDCRLNARFEFRFDVMAAGGTRATNAWVQAQIPTSGLAPKVNPRSMYQLLLFLVEQKP